MSQGFTLPDAATAAVDLTLAHQHGQAKLLPNSRVLCINRGNTSQSDTFDGHHIAIPPGYFETEYGAAQHFQRRLIVPGTRNLEVGGYVSWIGILGSTDGKIPVDKSDDCQPFAPEELIAYGCRIEAIDRDALSDPNAKHVKAIRTAAARAASFGQAAASRTGTQIDLSAQASEAAQEAAEHVFEPSADSATREAMAEAAADGVEPPTAPSMASVRARVRR